MTVAYSDEVRLYVKVLFIKIKILPSKDGKKVRGMSEKKAAKIRDSIKKKAQKKALTKKEKEKAKEIKDKKSILEIISNVKLITAIALTVIKTFFKHLRIKLTRIKIAVASDDAATTAVAYGAITQSLNLLLPALESVKTFKGIKRSEIDVRADFLQDTPVIDVEISFSIRVWHIFDVAFAAIGKFIKKKLSANASTAHKMQPPKNESKTANIK